jgi:hypothetical protein
MTIWLLVLSLMVSAEAKETVANEWLSYMEGDWERKLFLLPGDTPIIQRVKARRIGKVLVISNSTSIEVFFWNRKDGVLVQYESLPRSVTEEMLPGEATATAEMLKNPQLIEEAVNKHREKSGKNDIYLPNLYDRIDSNELRTKTPRPEMGLRYTDGRICRTRNGFVFEGEESILNRGPLMKYRVIFTKLPQKKKPPE